MAFDVLLFDLDNTLLDFDANEEASLRDVFQKNGIEFSNESFSLFKRINLSYWKKYEMGELSIDEVLVGRFRETLEALGRNELIPEEIEELYKHNLKNGTQIIDGAYELCKELSKKKRLYIATNGVREIQLSRLEKTGMLGFFQEVFDSESIGAGKPSLEFFEGVSKRIKGFSRENALMIGDSVSSDINGAISYGIKSCLFLNGRDIRDFSEVNCDYKISSLDELFEIV